MLSLYLCSLGKYAFAIFQAKLESIYRATFGRQQAKRFEVFAFPNSKLVLLSIHNLKWIKDFKVEHILVSRDTKSAFYWFQSFSLVQCIAGFLYITVRGLSIINCRIWLLGTNCISTTFLTTCTISIKLFTSNVKLNEVHFINFQLFSKNHPWILIFGFQNHKRQFIMDRTRNC